MALSLEQYGSTYLMARNALLKDILTKRSERQRKRSLGVSIKNGNRIPEHLLIEILSRMPVIDLLRFKTVCKSWYAIIKSSHFITKHLRNYYDDDSNWRDCLIAQYCVTQDGELSVFELLIDNKKNRALGYQCIYTPVYSTYLCGPCHGIYFLWCFSSDRKRTMWNPALNEFIILPEIPWEPKIPLSSASVHESYGFGYDSKSRDYKVILILGYTDIREHSSSLSDVPMSILVYSLRANSWRYWGDMDKSYDLEWNRCYVFVNGCYYWLVKIPNSDRDYEMILSFDIAAEAYHEIPLPHFESKPDYGSQLVVYHDSIAFVSVPDDNTSFCVWTWSEGVWAQKLSVKLDFRVWGAISAWRDNNTLIFKQMWGKLMMCDTNTKEIFALDDPQVGRCETICAYKESLVSIKDLQKGSKHKGRRS
ncbi:hypothetical protein vseg_002081 [Gypsophila vaccaria]